MVLMSVQEQTPKNEFNYLKITKPAQMVDVHYVLNPIKGSIKPGYPEGLTIYLQPPKQIE